MIHIPPFNSAQAKILQSFLDAPERSADSMGYAEAAGFLFAVACAPELVEPSEWLPIIIDPDNASITSVENMKSITGGLMSLYNEMTRQVQKADAKLPPGINFRGDVMANLEPDASISLWSSGFKAGYFRLEQMWSAYIPDELKEDSGYQITVLCFFSSMNVATELHEDVKNEEVTIEEMAKNMVRLFPDALEGVAELGLSIQQVLARREGEDSGQEAQSKKVGRNDPCLCGSGKKYKKCCGLTLH
jgi:uncharacterized protein